MISYHKGYIMIPLMFLGFASGAAPALFALTAATNATGALGACVDMLTAKKQNEFKYNRSMEELASILQRNLANVRIIAGFNADYYAKNMSVTKQVISNLETGKVKMSTQSGVAWTVVVKILANSLPNNIPLQKTCNLLLYGLNDYSDEEINKFEEVISKIAKAKKAGVDDETLELLASFLPDIKG